MQFDKEALIELITMVVENTIKALNNKQMLNAGGIKKRTAYQKTEQLLYSYNNLHKIVNERREYIKELRQYGVPKKSKSIVEYHSYCGGVKTPVLEEESVENAVHNVQASVDDIVQVIHLIDKCMAALSNDPYYSILEMRYFEGRTQEDMAHVLKCDQATISRNRTRLVKELSLRLFPNDVIAEYMM